MANENKDVIRIRDTAANLDNGVSSTQRQKQLGFGSDTYKIYFRDTDDTIYHYPAEEQDATYDNLNVMDSIIHSGDTDTKIALTADRMTTTVGSVEFIDLLEDGSQDTLEINRGEVDVDTVINAAVGQALLVHGSDGFVSIGTDTAPSGHLQVEDLTINTTSNYLGIVSYHTKTAGATDAADAFFGIDNISILNQTGGTIGSFAGISTKSTLTDGTTTNGWGILNEFQMDGGTASGDVRVFNAIGDLNAGTISTAYYCGRFITEQEAGNTISNDTYGIYNEYQMDGGSIGIDLMINYNEADLNGGTITGDFYNGYFLTDQAGGTISGDAFNLFIDSNFAGTVTGTAYNFYLKETAGLDYNIYQAGGTKNYFAADTGIQQLSPSTALHIGDNTASIPALASGTQLYIEGENAAADAGIQLSVDGTEACFLYAGNDTHNLEGGGFLWDIDNGLFKVYNVEQERARWQGGDVRFQNNNSGVQGNPTSALMHLVNDTAAEVCNKLEQNDDDYAFTDYVGTSATNNLKSISTVTSYTAQGAVKVKINGSDKWIQYYDAA